MSKEVKAQTFEEIKAEMIDVMREPIHDNPYQIGSHLRNYTDKMVAAAVRKLDDETLRYIEVGKAAEAFFGSMKLK